MTDDFRDILVAFTRSGVEFLVVGAHALAANGVTGRRNMETTDVGES